MLNTSPSGIASSIEIPARDLRSDPQEGRINSIKAYIKNGRNETPKPSFPNTL
jgi:hypothetical protein